MNSDFNFVKICWKKLLAFALCVALALPTTSVFAATAGGNVVTQQKITVYAKAKVQDVSGNAKYTYTYTYTGKAIKPKITVMGFSTGKTISSKNYTVTYGVFNSEGEFVKKTPKEVGLYYAKITFKGDCKKFLPIYCGFEIVPKKATVSSVTGQKNAMTVKWKNAGKSQATYYEIQYSTDKRFTQYPEYMWSWYGIKVETVSSKKGVSSTTLKLNEKLKKDTAYYVRVRAVKEIEDIQLYSSTYIYKNHAYGDWSKLKKVTVKK